MEVQLSVSSQRLSRASCSHI